jgi:hypothetical protein
MGGLAQPRKREDVPFFPVEIDHIWEWFGEILAGCESGFGPAIVSWQAMRAWADFMQVDLDPWEARALVKLGEERAAILSETPDANHQDPAHQ